MSSEQTFAITVNGIEYDVYTSTRGTRDTFRITTNNANLVITDSFGECNPLRSLWDDWQYQAVHGAAREAMELKCIKDAVEREIETHMEFCLQQIEDNEVDENTEIAENRAKAENQRAAALKATENYEWNRKVQAAVARQDAQAAHEITQRLTVSGKSIIFDGQAFSWERTAGGGIRIDPKFNDAARTSGLRGQAIGELYSLAQKMVSLAQ